MRSSYMASLRSRAHKRHLQDHPGQVKLADVDGAPTVDASVVIGPAGMETDEGNYIRTRSATIRVSKAKFGDLPDIEKRPPIEITQPGRPTETFSIVEAHEQDPATWFIRAVKWGS